MECRVVGGKQRNDEEIIWYRENEDQIGEMITHGETLLLMDERIKLERTAFEDLVIQRIEVNNTLF